MDPTPPADFATAAQTIDRATYESLRRAVELGRWPDGRALTRRQREICVEAVIAWEAHHCTPSGRTGALARSRCDDAPERDDAVAIRFLDEP